jgi:hypothetical protein
MKTRLIAFIAVVLLLALAVGVLFAQRSAAPPATKTQNQNSNNSATQSVQNSTILSDCLEKVNKSDANETVLAEGRAACYEKYQ